MGSTPEGRSRRDIVSVVVDVQPVLDLSTEVIRQRFAVTTDELCADTDDAIELCRSIATWARDQGYSAILAPSAALAGEHNLVIYVDGPPDRLHLEVGPDRIPLVP